MLQACRSLTFFLHHVPCWPSGRMLHLEGKCQVLGSLVGDPIPPQGQPDQTTGLRIGDESQGDGLDSLISNVVAAKLCIGQQDSVLVLVTR